MHTCTFVHAHINIIISRLSLSNINSVHAYFVRVCLVVCVFFYPNKTEYLLNNIKNINVPVSIYLKLNTISPSKSAKNLGIIFQSDMLMDKHISYVVKTCFLQLSEFRHIQIFIPKSAAITFANAFIHSRIHYCYNLVYGLPKYSLYRLQKGQNSIARIVTRTSHSSHITPIVKSLLWLPVKYRINFKHSSSCSVIKGTSLFKLIAYSQMKSTFSSFFFL